jgi:hypothetical protein
MTDAMISFKVTGVDKVVAALKQAGLDIAEAFGAGLVSGALIVEKDAKDHAPYKTGNLKRDIHIGSANSTGDVKVNVTEPQATDNAPPQYNSQGFAEIIKDLRESSRAVVAVGTDQSVPYAAAQEYLSERMGGGGPFGSNKGPFLRPALDDNHARVSKEVSAATRAVIAKVVKSA